MGASTLAEGYGGTACSGWWRRPVGCVGKAKRVKNMDMEFIPYLFILLGIVFFLVAFLPGSAKTEEWIGRLEVRHSLVVSVVGIMLGAGGLWMLQNNVPEASFSISPTGPGMQGLTNFSFDASSSSDLDNDGQLTYTWNFGDGITNSGKKTKHVYREAGTFTVTLEVSDGKDQATSSRDVTVDRSISRSYFSYDRSDDRYDAALDLTQAAVGTDGKIKGAAMEPILWEGGRSGANLGDVLLNGEIASDNNFVCPCDIRLESSDESEKFYSFNGVLEPGTSTMVGNIQVHNIFEIKIDRRVVYHRHR